MNGKSCLILGVGNTLRRDDGAGPAAVQRLKELKKSGSIDLSSCSIVDGGTDGLGLIEYLKDYERVILIDAVNMNASPGTVRLFIPEEAVIRIRTDSLSTHGFGIAELLTLSRELGIQPEITIVGVQPEDTGYGEYLSPQIEAALVDICNRIIETISTAIPTKKLGNEYES